jgi:hypothetical protein
MKQVKEITNKKYVFGGRLTIGKVDEWKGGIIEVSLLPDIVISFYKKNFQIQLRWLIFNVYFLTNN